MIRAYPRWNPTSYRAAPWCAIVMLLIFAALMLSSSSLSDVTMAADDDPAQSSLNRPRGVAVDRMGNVYIADSGNGRILLYPRNGPCRVILERLNEPSGLAVDNLRNILYVAETGSNRILCIATTNYQTMICVQGIVSQPTGLAIDEFGNLYIADTGNSRILRRTPQGGTCAVRTDPVRLTRPQGVAVGLGELVIADTGNNRILRRPLLTACEAGLVMMVETEPLNQPTGLAVVATGLYIADTCNNRILQVDITGATSLVAGIGPVGCGSGRFCGDDGLAMQACLNVPEGLAPYLNSLLIADVGNNRIRRVDLGTGMITSAECR